MGLGVPADRTERPYGVQLPRGAAQPAKPPLPDAVLQHDDHDDCQLRRHHPAQSARPITRRPRERDRTAIPRAATRARRSDGAALPAASRAKRVNSTSRRIRQAWTPSVDSSLGPTLLPTVLSVTAGSVDAIGFLGLGLFTAHITGNLVVAAAHIVSGGSARLAPMLAVPVFMVALGLARLLSGGLDSIGVSAPRPLLVLEFFLLAAFLVVCVAVGPRIDPNAASAVLAGMLGVSAMAVQNALMQIALRG